MASTHHSLHHRFSLFQQPLNRNRKNYYPFYIYFLYVDAEYLCIGYPSLLPDILFNCFIHSFRETFFPFTIQVPAPSSNSKSICWFRRKCPIFISKCYFDRVRQCFIHRICIFYNRLCTNISKTTGSQKSIRIFICRIRCNK